MLPAGEDAALTEFARSRARRERGLIADRSEPAEWATFRPLRGRSDFRTRPASAKGTLGAVSAAVFQDASWWNTGTGFWLGSGGVILGVANNRSIAWGIARSARAHGAELAFTYQGDALRKRVEPLAKELDAQVIGHCDVTDAASIDAVFEEAARIFPEGIDFVVHCIAFSDKDELTGRYIETSEDNFTKSLLISCYSFTAVAQRAEKICAPVAPC